LAVKATRLLPSAAVGARLGCQVSNFSGQPAAVWTCNPRVDTEPLAREGEWHLRCAGCC